MIGAAVVAGSAAGAADRPHCGGSQVETLAQSRVLRIYASRRSDLYYACFRRTGKRVRIGERADSSSYYRFISPAAVAGAVGAWQEQEAITIDPACETRNHLYVTDFGRHRHLARVALRHNGEVKELAVKRTGAFAWIEARPPADDFCSEARTYLVRRRDSRGSVVLAAGESEPRDLRVAGSRLTWADDAGTHSASIR